MNTVIIGAVFVDVKGFAFDPYAPTGTNIGSVRFVHGGVCRNVCEDFGNQGERASFVSMTDNSALGREVRDRLANLNIDLRHTLFADDGMGMWLAILDEHGDLVGSVSKQPDFRPLEEYLRVHGEEIIAHADNIVLEIDMNEAIAEMVLRFAEKHRKPVYAIVGNMAVILRHPEFLRHVSVFICNEIEAGRLFGADLTHRSPFEMLDALLVGAKRAGVNSMVITMGEKGAVYCDGATGEAGHCPAIPTEMVDSTGAGDAFFAGTVMALNRGMPLKRAVGAGTRLASATLRCKESSCARLDGLFD